MSKDSSFLARFFGFAKYKTNMRIELLAGTTTFLTMAYILLVNPFLLGKEAGMDFGAVFVATAVAAAMGSLLMGVISKLSDCPRPRHGFKCLFYLYGCYWYGC